MIVLNGFLAKISAFMADRNGPDRLTLVFGILYLLFNGIKMCFRFHPVPYYILLVLALASLAYALFRVFSKNVWKRREEEARFENFCRRASSSEFFYTLRRKFNRAKVRLSQIRTHRFRTCPNCNEHLRLSKKRGKRSITCPRCGKKFKVFIIF